MATHKTNTIDYKVYGEIDGNMQYIMNTTDVTLPEISYATEETNLSGMGGSVDMPNPYNLEAMSLEFGNTTDAQTTAMLQTPGVKTIEIRWVVNTLETETVQTGLDEHRVLMKVIPKKYTLGKIERGSAMDAKNEFSVIYMKKILNGYEMFEIDVFNRKLVFNGTDYAQNLNGFLG